MLRRMIPLAALIAASTATAQSSYQPYLLGLRTAGMGGSAVALGHDSAMPWKNPAGLAWGQSAQLGVASNSLVLSEDSAAEYYGLSDEYRRGHGILEGDFRSTIDGTTTSVFPNSITFTVPLDDGTNFLGLAFVAPFAEVQDSVTDITLDTGGGFSARQFIQDRRELRSYAIGPTYALALGEHARLGTAVFLRYTSLRERSSQERSDHSLDSRDVGVDASEFAAQGDGFDLDIAAGLQIGPLGGFHVGVAAHAPSINLFGRYQEQGRSYCGDCLGDGVIGVTEFDGSGTHFDLSSPAWFSIGVGYERPGAFAIGVDVSYWLPIDSYPWATIDAELRQVVNDARDPRQLNSVEALELMSDPRDGVFNVNAGIEVYVAERVVLRSGFFTDFSALPELPIDDERTSEHLGRRRIDRYGASFGAAYEGRTTSFQVGLVYLGGLGELVGLQLEQGRDATHPTRELASNVFMLSFSGEIDAGQLISAASDAVREELSR